MKEISTLSTFALFRGIEESDLPGLLSCMEAGELSFRKGETLLHCGERTEQLGLVLAGTVHIVRDDFWGNRSIVGFAGPGDVFAESYALTGEPLGVSALAATDCAVLFFDASKVISGCAQVCGFHEQLSRNLLGMVAKKNLLLKLAQKNFEGTAKLLNFLIRIHVLT